MAHDQVYGTCVEQGVILMCSKDGFFQRFIVNGKNFTRHKHKFLEKIGQFYLKTGQKKGQKKVKKALFRVKKGFLGLF